MCAATLPTFLRLRYGAQSTARDPMIYDLSQPVFHDAPQWATYPSITVTLEHRIATDGFNAEHAKLTTHLGTHIDTPFHFFPGAETVGRKGSMVRGVSDAIKGASAPHGVAQLGGTQTNFPPNY